jgi:hypothetical protein
MALPGRQFASEQTVTLIGHTPPRNSKSAHPRPLPNLDAGRTRVHRRRAAWDGHSGADVR